MFANSPQPSILLLKAQPTRERRVTAMERPPLKLASEVTGEKHPGENPDLEASANAEKTLAWTLFVE